MKSRIMYEILLVVGLSLITDLDLQPHPGAEPSEARIRPATAKCKGSIPRQA